LPSQCGGVRAARYTGGMASLDLDVVRHALSKAREHGFREIELVVGEDQFSARLAGFAQTSVPPTVSANPEEAAMPQTMAISSPLVGYFREGSKPLQVDDIVKKGDSVCVIVALGLANEVESKVDGRVVEVLVEPGQAVEFGQVLARVMPE